MAIASAIRRTILGPNVADKLSDFRAAGATAAAYLRETQRLEAQVDAAQAKRVDLDAQRRTIEAENGDVLAGGDTAAAREVLAKLDAIDAEIRVIDRIVAATQKAIFDRERTGDLSRLQRRESEARQLVFASIRDAYLEKLTPEIVELVCRAQMASAQAGDGLNFGPFCERHLRNSKSKATDHSIPDRIAYANDLLAEVES